MNLNANISFPAVSAITAIANRASVKALKPSSFLYSAHPRFKVFNEQVHKHWSDQT